MNKINQDFIIKPSICLSDGLSSYKCEVRPQIGGDGVRRGEGS